MKGPIGGLPTWAFLEDDKYQIPPLRLTYLYTFSICLSASFELVGQESLWVGVLGYTHMYDLLMLTEDNKYLISTSWLYLVVHPAGYLYITRISS